MLKIKIKFQEIEIHFVERKKWENVTESSMMKMKKYFELANENCRSEREDITIRIFYIFFIRNEGWTDHLMPFVSSNWVKPLPGNKEVHQREALKEWKKEWKTRMQEKLSCIIVINTPTDIYIFKNLI